MHAPLCNALRCVQPDTRDLVVDVAVDLIVEKTYENFFFKGQYDTGRAKCARTQWLISFYP